MDVKEDAFTSILSPDLQDLYLMSSLNRKAETQNGEVTSSMSLSYWLVEQGSKY